MRRLRRPVASAVAALLAATSAGCAADDPPFADHGGAVVSVAAAGCSLEPDIGAGVVVDHDGTALVLTSAHTVAGAKTITLGHGDAEHTATLVGFDPALDVAVLTAPIPADPLPLTRPQRDGAVALLIPDDARVRRVPTRIDRLLRVTIEDIYREDDVQRQAFEFAAGIEPGDSGAPVVDPSGAVVGIVYARSRDRGGVGFAVSGTDLLTLVDGIDPTTPVDPGRCL